MDIYFAGPSTREKIMLMSYLGLILSADKKVLVKTKEKHFFTNTDMVFFGDNLSIGTKFINADIVLSEPVDEAADFFVYDLLANFPKNRHDFVLRASDNKCKYIFLNNINYSKINKKYLLAKFGVDDKDAYFLALDEGDISKNIENCFDERLSLKGISKNYKDLLVDIASEILESDVKQSRQLFKLALRSC